MEYSIVGKITNTHGIKGELKVKSSTDFKDERYRKGNVLYIFHNDEIIKVKMKSHRVHKTYDLLTFEEFNNINDVEKFKNSLIKTPVKDLSLLDNDEFYYHDLIGLDVYEDDFVGVVHDVREVPQGEILVIKRENKKDSLVPFREQFIETVDLEDKKITLKKIEGLL